jgi:hypothetical protein
VGAGRSGEGLGGSSPSTSGGIVNTISIGKSIFGQSAKSLVRARQGVLEVAGSSKGKIPVALKIVGCSVGTMPSGAAGFRTRRPFNSDVEGNDLPEELSDETGAGKF